MTDAKAWIEERRAALAHVLKHPHPDPAAEWAQTALNALNKVLERVDRMEADANTYGDAGHDLARDALFAYVVTLRQAIEGAINDD